MRETYLGALSRPRTAEFGVPRGSGLLILAPFGPQSLVGSPHLPKDTARHLRRQGKLLSYLLIQIVVQLPAVARPAARKGMRARQVEAHPGRPVGSGGALETALASSSV